MIRRRRFFSYKSFHARKKKNQVPTSYLLQDLPLSFFYPKSCSSQESENFFCQRATYKGSWSTGSQGSHWVRQGWSVATKGGREKENKKTKEGGLSPQEGDVRKAWKRKEKKRKRPRKARWWLLQRQGSVCPTPRIFFLVHKYLGSEVTHLDWSIGSCVILYKEAMCEGSSGNGLLYAAKAVP